MTRYTPYYQRDALIATIVLIVLCMPAWAIPNMSEYTVKAVFFERFARFVTWPDGLGMDDNSKSFVITVIGKNPFSSILEKLYAKRKIKDKKVEIRYIEKPEEIKTCHILFISDSMKNQLESILEITEKLPILTIGDTEGFAENRVHINLYTETQEYPFEINAGATRESGLEMDYVLLNMAKIIE